MQPYHNNLTNRLIKTPKLYFLDTGLCAYLTKWSTPQALEAGAFSGAILETWVISELLKSYWYNGKTPCFYFYRDKDQKEIDLLIEQNTCLWSTNDDGAQAQIPLSKMPLSKCLFSPLDRRATLAMTATPVIASAAKQSSQSNNRRSRRGDPAPPSLREGEADVAIQMPLSKMPLIKCLFNPLDRRAALAMTATPVIASAAKQSSQSNNRRSRRGNPAHPSLRGAQRRGNPDASIQMPF